MSASPLRRGRTPFTREVRWELHGPSETARALPLVVALHGLGQSGAAFAETLAPLRGPERFVVFPDGPLVFEVHENGGRREGHAWYVFTGDQAAFMASAQQTELWLDRVIEQVVTEHPVDRRRIVLLGYSQGGYLAGIMALRRPALFAGLVTLASRIKAETFDPQTSGARPPILVLHGERDRFVDAASAQASAQRLAESGFEVTVKRHEAGHRIVPAQVRDAVAWLEAHGL